MAPPLTGGSGLIQIAQSKEGSMKRILCSLIVAALPFGAAFAQTAPQPIVTPVMQKDLTDLPGREMLMLAVEYPPGTVEHIHRHDASAFVYVLEGSIVEGVRGGKEVTLTPGQTFYEGPDDVHTVGRNASTTKPAKFIVVLVKKKGVDAVLPAQ
jgi:quercetin dioxygenase-like cupin family protein